MSIFLKRVEVKELFNRVNSHLSRNSKNASNRQLRFIVLKRMHACVKADSSSIKFFFSHIYRVKTLRTVLFQKLLIYSLKSSFVLDFLLKRKLITSLFLIPENYSEKWEDIDVLFAEWDFVGVFSNKNVEVHHLLVSPKYLSKLRNEIDARIELSTLINIPALKKYELNDLGWYTDELSVSSYGQLTSEGDFENAQLQLIKVYRETEKTLVLQEYLTSLLQRANLFYGNNIKFLKYIHELFKFINADTSLNINQIIKIVRCHGDFNKGQILNKNSDVFIIDWAESEYNFILHDLVYNFLFKSKRATIDWKVIENDSPLLYRYICKEISYEISNKILIIITLLEVALKQHAAYNENRGSIETWLNIYNGIKVNY